MFNPEGLGGNGDGSGDDPKKNLNENRSPKEISRTERKLNARLETTREILQAEHGLEVMDSQGRIDPEKFIMTAEQFKAYCDQTGRALTDNVFSHDKVTRETAEADRQDIKNKMANLNVQDREKAKQLGLERPGERLEQITVIALNEILPEGIFAIRTAKHDDLKGADILICDQNGVIAALDTTARRREDPKYREKTQRAYDRNRAQGTTVKYGLYPYRDIADPSQTHLGCGEAQKIPLFVFQQSIVDVGSKSRTMLSDSRTERNATEKDLLANLALQVDAEIRDLQKHELNPIVEKRIKRFQELIKQASAEQGIDVQLEQKNLFP